MFALIIICFGVSMMIIGTRPSIVWKDGNPDNPDPSVTFTLFAWVLPSVILIGILFTYFGFHFTPDPIPGGFMVFVVFGGFLGWIFITFFGTIFFGFFIEMDIARSFIAAAWTGFILIGLVVALLHSSNTTEAGIGILLQG